MWTIENRREWQRNYYNKRKKDISFIEGKKVSAKKSYQKNKVKRLKWHKSYYQIPENKLKYNEYRRRYRWENPIGIYSVIESGIKKRNNKIKLEITKQDFAEWYLNETKKCFYCKITLDEMKKIGDRMNKKINRFTVDRVDNKQGYIKNNLVLCCYRCNAIKSDYFTKEEMLKIGEIVYAKNQRIE